MSPLQGRFLCLLARLAGARRVLEIGTLGGYSTIWLARALPDDGRVVTLEIDPARAAVARENLVRAGVDGRRGADRRGGARRGIGQRGSDRRRTGARHPRNNRDWPAVGIFAQRGKNRPNRIASTICRIVRREGRRLVIAELDAIDGTPVLDVKPVIAEFPPRGECAGRSGRAS